MNYCLPKTKCLFNPRKLKRGIGSLSPLCDAIAAAAILMLTCVGQVVLLECFGAQTVQIIVVVHSSRDDIKGWVI